MNAKKNCVASLRVYNVRVACGLRFGSGFIVIVTLVFIYIFFPQQISFSLVAPPFDVFPPHIHVLGAGALASVFPFFNLFSALRTQRSLKDTRCVRISRIAYVWIYI